MAISPLERETAPDVAHDELHRLVADNTLFAFDLYQTLRQEEEDNFFYSPYSISVALAMTYAGARGETERQMEQALHYSLGQTDLHPAFNVLDQQLTGAASNARWQLSVANSLWTQEGYSWRAEYLDGLVLNYGAGLHQVDFTDDDRRELARQAINRWTAEETEGQISELIPFGGLDMWTRMVLVNAIYFKGEWEFPFDFASDGDFHLLNGQTVRAPMMSRRSYTRIAEGPGYQAVELVYRSSPIRMIILLPDEGLFEESEREFTLEQWERVMLDLERTYLSLTMPRFALESEFDLAKLLTTRGMFDAFEPLAADFSGMYERAPRSEGSLFLSHITHKAFVAVDELGTEAAAATGVTVQEVEGAADQIVVNRPFIFVISDLRNGTILFAGRLVDPS